MAGFLKRLVPKRFQKKGIVIPVVRLHGPIMSGGSRFRPALNLASVAGQLEKALGKLSRKGIPIADIGRVQPTFGKPTLYATEGGRVAVGLPIRS